MFSASAFIKQIFSIIAVSTIVMKQPINLLYALFEDELSTYFTADIILTLRSMISAIYKGAQLFGIRSIFSVFMDIIRYDDASEITKCRKTGVNTS